MATILQEHSPPQGQDRQSFVTTNNLPDYCYCGYTYPKLYRRQNADFRTLTFGMKREFIGKIDNTVVIESPDFHPRAVTKSGFASWQAAFNYWNFHTSKDIMFSRYGLTFINTGQSMHCTDSVRFTGIWGIRLIIWQDGSAWSLQLKKGFKALTSGEYKTSEMSWGNDSPREFEEFPDSDDDDDDGD